MTQTLSITQQLHAGIRFFDFRVQMYQQEVHTVHGLYGRRLNELLLEMVHFVREHPTEILLVNINHCYSMAPHDVQHCFDMVMQLFTPLLVPCNQHNLDVPIKALIAQNHRVFVFHDNPYRLKMPRLLWPRKTLSIFWPNAQTPAHARTRILQEGLPQLARQQRKVTVLDLIITPNGWTVATGLVPFATKLKSTLAVSQAAKPYLLSLLHSLEFHKFPLNVLLFDFVEENDPFVEYCIMRSLETAFAVVLM